ncbi:AAA-type ATPase lid domain-containing protein [Desulfocicer niacini]
MISTFIRRLNRSTGKSITGLSHDAMETIMDCNWPGNVRELKNAMEYAFVTTDGTVIHLEDLPRKINSPRTGVGTTQEKIMEEIPFSSERDQLIKALQQTGGNQTKAAQLLGINRVTVWNRMKKYGIDLKKVLSV